MNITGNITKNFSLIEMACNDVAGTLVLTPEAVAHAQRLQKFRLWYNRPIRVNSWYRTAAYNKQIGGVANSQHLQGIATDIALPSEFYQFTAKRKQEFFDNIKNKWQELCAADGLQGGIGYYDSFFHLDSRAGTGKAPIHNWDYRKK